jgi:trimeric autotransporter adhesin
MKKNMLIILIILIGSASMVKAQNTKYGTNALYSNTTGIYNSAFGYQALYLNTTGGYNSSFGSLALYSNISGNDNSSFGFSALCLNTDGNRNTAMGYYALAYNTTGSYNTAIGSHSLVSNVSGEKNTAVGHSSLYMNTIGTNNTSVGESSLYGNISGHDNTAIGFQPLYTNTTGYCNIGIGNAALKNNISGCYNLADGLSALSSNTIGKYNTTSGNYSLSNNTEGDKNVALGYYAGYSVTTYDNSISIGYIATATNSNQVRIGNSNITSIGGQVSWTTLSDGRFKKEIKHDVPGLEFINKLEPVSYILDKEAFDDFIKVPDSLRINDKVVPITHSGFIAQDVEKILQDMNITSFSGVDLPKNKNDYYGIRYAEFVVPLVKSVQELSALDKKKDLKIESLEEKINRLEKIIMDAGLVSDMSTVTQIQSGMNQNNPNPFSNSTEIKCFVPSGAITALLMIFDMNGKQIKTFTITERGNCLVKVNASELNGAGMYVYSLFIDNNEISTKRMVLSE